MDTVFIENLRLDCRVGVTDEERRLPQKVLVDVTLTLDLSRAASSKKIGDTVDYREAKRQFSQFVSSGEFVLLETLAEGVAALALGRFEVERVAVRVRKEKYSVEPSIGIRIERARGPGSR
ncbi:MAG TPA: dihydroneopterin aldolase [Nitrososphaerales archaeon]|nr:dihydroneopterin aldolase [Nitrososphaerales archaeon]